MLFADGRNVLLTFASDDLKSIFLDVRYTQKQKELLTIQEFRLREYLQRLIFYISLLHTYR